MTKHVGHVKEKGNTSNIKVSLANIVRKKTEVSVNWKHFKSSISGEKKVMLERNSRKVQTFKSENISGNFNADKRIGKDTREKSHLIETGDKDSVKTPKITRHIAMDCEMVGVDNDGKDSILARVSLVNKFGDCIYDKFVKPRETVTDYRTRYSGVREKDLRDAEEFEVVQKEVADILDGRILVGHALSNDLKVLFLSHPRKRMRDTSKYRPFRKLNNNRTPSLRKLASVVLGVAIQQGEHDSVIDANTAMQLYLLYRKEWEKRTAYEENEKTNEAEKVV